MAITELFVDSKLIPDLLSDSGNLFQLLRDEVQWTSMVHKGGEVPRLVALQSERGDDGARPLYRHPIDQEPPVLDWSSTVDLIRIVIQDVVGLKLNHCLIQLYRSGHDFIGEHSDKTLDILTGTPILNYSVGATRQLLLRPKKDRRTTNQNLRVDLPHNSLLVLGWQTNIETLHSIRRDKRANRDKRPDEMIEEGARISLTFRSIATWKIELDGREYIYGQGAPHKTREELSNADNFEVDVHDEEERLRRAFTAENSQSTFDWQQHYGNGFNIKLINSEKISELSLGNRYKSRDVGSIITLIITNHRGGCRPSRVNLTIMPVDINCDKLPIRGQIFFSAPATFHSW